MTGQLREGMGERLGQAAIRPGQIMLRGRGTNNPIGGQAVGNLDRVRSPRLKKYA